MKKIKLILPKGHIQEKVMRILSRIGLEFSLSSRSYRPASNNPEVEAKMLRTQNIAALVALGKHDCGFTGIDWVREERADVVELLDLGLDPVRIVAAVPEELFGKDLGSREIVVASEYRNLAMDYIREKGLKAVFVQAYGATEALPPEDADMIIDNTATGTTLEQNRLKIVDEIMTSTTRFVCNRESYEKDSWKRKKLDEMAMLMRSAINADERRLLEMNVPGECFEALVKDLPCMRAPTVAPLHNEDGYAVKIALPARDVAKIIPKLVEAGARDILEYRLEKIVV